MANVFDTAKYILEKTGTMSTMKLQKLCYYSQAWSLVWDDAPLFEEEFQAWANGPVCSELFYKTKGKYSVNAEDENGGENNLSDNQKDTIDKVVEYYGKHNAQWLSQLTHMEDPWIKAREGMPLGAGCDNIITKESMAMYYGGI
nr:type II toxin-antitoxin system antitoxin SocA domain-containing protein [uncultured Anaerobutyricum sp.]